MAAVAHDKLTYVNRILLAVGMGPVSTVAQTRASAAAEDTLDQADAEVQERGWHFNTDKDVTIAPIASAVNVPTDALRIDPEDPSLDYVQIGTTMFDRDNNTATINKTTKYRIIRLRDFTDLPSAAQDYIAAVAARRYQALMLGSPQADRELARVEMLALTKLTTQDAQNSEANSLLQSFSVWRATGRPGLNSRLVF